MRQQVEGDLVRVNFFDHLAVLRPSAGLLLQLGDPGRPTARDGLVSRCDDRLQAKGLVQRVKPHQRDDRRAIRIGDDALVRESRIRIDFRNHQGYLRIHPESRAIIDHDTAALGGLLPKKFRLRGPRTEDAGIQPLETLRSRFLYRPGLVSVGLRLTSRAGRGEQAQFRQREIPLVKKTNEFLTDCAGRSEDSDFICHWIL